ncbi:UDP-N-acetylglucosamine--N-acetylmuramyl-(pentapeptide) pyrophosphoryl-undecaprenol N-acetylglucosamine transferase [Pseudoclavibacter sp. RFBI5]|uniref:UDP-N-acetylglucosamine--N-acetylmuramyl- (pentapeptide) pyrophosphoryl-undecaprenol N-acetylglucosamine transferase n=1 Tax=Pseudoclavibacter sp. RFBI5 TaxID=2080578 RepID=UPI000CE7B6A2|nr:UDP-N-acetylglucosamine--N-acetylmuramyl-(pentapeptide) pyrophosphoryl-undecaprenol N-acetylglucosamine transferase [Pseudoclavibacter sp. RFBI5]PPG02470.1 UDP-N-acetylglucosamine--N-acetylmuramyl-(pentapeptide) pyrophosphoryl-undecaprenol N-acetylglucosamine transferase [Pseudoclavibacter sp. RFBI5]
MTNYLLAGGGTAGHVNPLLAVADALRARDPESKIFVLGTKEGLEARLVPARGYELLTIPKLPFPRRPNAQVLTFLPRLRETVSSVRRMLVEHDIDAVAGFGGYAAAPAYLAARGRVPIVVHEANALPGMANKLGARWAKRVGVAFDGTPLRGAVTVGMPLRAEIERLDRAAKRSEAVEFFGLDPARRTLLVTGGSLGARRVNETVRAVVPELIAEGWQVLHLVGGLSKFEHDELDGYHVLEYCDRMDLAFAAADLVVARAGASTVSELGVVGLPAVYVPYPAATGDHQTINIRSVLAAGGALRVTDGDFSPEWASKELLALARDDERRARMEAATLASAQRDGAARVVTLLDEALRSPQGR